MKAALIIVAALWIGWHGVPLLFLVGILAAAVWVSSALNGSTASAYRTVHGHTANRQAAATHEAGHAVVARYVGASDITTIARNNGAGWTSYRPSEHMTPAEQIAIALAGGMAEGVSIDSAPCRGDKASIKRPLRRAGWFQQGAVMRQAEQIAAAGLRRYSGDVRRMSRRLERSTRVRYR